MSDRIALMIDGRIEQLGTPDDLYQRPATLAVARFIGSPTINLLAAEADSESRVTIAGRATGILARPGPLTIGIRPEDLDVGDEGLAAEVVRVETHGPDRFLTCMLQADRSTVVLRQGANARPARGDMLKLRIPPERAHLFGADGQRVPARIAGRVAA